jgi:hypothetical protein
LIAVEADGNQVVNSICCKTGRKRSFRKNTNCDSPKGDSLIPALGMVSPRSLHHEFHWGGVRRTGLANAEMIVASHMNGYASAYVDIKTVFEASLTDASLIDQFTAVPFMTLAVMVEERKQHEAVLHNLTVAAPELTHGDNFSSAFP